VLRPGKLVLGKTLEKVELPLLDNGTSLAARIEGKSSYARCATAIASACLAVSIWAWDRPVSRSASVSGVLAGCPAVVCLLSSEILTSVYIQVNTAPRTPYQLGN
jgi:hypothetical protein